MKKQGLFLRFFTFFAVAVISLAPAGLLHAQAPEKALEQAQVSSDQKIDQAMQVFTDYDLLRLRARGPVKKGPGVKPPFKQEPPSAQKDFCPKCP